MKTELKKKIYEIIIAYKSNAAQNAADIKAYLEDAVLNSTDNAREYTPEFLRDSIIDGMKKITDAEKQVNKVFNQKLNAVLAEVRNMLIPQESSKPADYQVMINNAIQFLNMEGEITDETAFLILKDLITDYTSMKLFKNMIGKKVELEDSKGNTTFPKTFGKLNQVESILNLISEIEAIANMLFLHQKSNSQEYIIRNNIYFVPADAYSQMADEGNIVDLAEVLDELAAKYEMTVTVSE